MTRERVLHWDGCVNARDLGGLPTENGEVTRFGQVVRADEIARLTAAGWRAASEYGVRVAIDLRAAHDEGNAPPPGVPIQTVRIPIDPRVVPEAFRWESMMAAYCALLEAYASAFARAVETIGAERDPVVVIHCAGGRDRTGLAVALLLRLAGVAPETIADDHAISDESWAPYHAAWFDRAEDDEERARRERVAVPAGRAMVEVLEEVERRYGGPQTYLLGGGARPEALAAARDRLIA